MNTVLKSTLIKSLLAATLGLGLAGAVNADAEWKKAGATSATGANVKSTAIQLQQVSEMPEHSEDLERITALTQLWTSAWNVGDGEFDPQIFNDIFAPGQEAISVFDNVQGDVLTLSDVESYVNTWGPFMDPLPVWSVEMRDLKIDISGDMALSTFRLVGTDTRAPDGSAFPFGQYGTHVWKKLPEQGWRLVHEHLTAYDIANPKHES